MAVDLFCGLGGWAEGLLAEGWDVVGFDIERHAYGAHRYPGHLVLQDILTLHGSQFPNAALIVASPPCQFFSYCAMPWSRAKALAAEVEADIERLEGELALFRACFRLQREASEAAGRRIPLVVENVRGAQRWVGRARWNYGSFYLWGDVPALMPLVGGRKNNGGSWFAVAHNTTSGKGNNPDGRNPSASPYAEKRRGTGAGTVSLGGDAGRQALEGVKGVPHRTEGHWTNPAEHRGVKHQESGAAWWRTGHGALPSSSPRRKAASALIAKIPLPLARHIGRTFRP